MVVREYDYIKGSTATNPSRKTKIGKTYKKSQQNKKKRKLQIKNRKKNDRRYVLTIAIVIFSLGCITVWGDSKVYVMQKQVSDLNTQIKQTQEQNEALKVKVLKFSSLSSIQEKAETKLGMAVTSKQDIVRIDFSDNYFKDVNLDDVSKKKERNLFSKLMSLIK